jgi:hypothetical protein
MASKSTKVSSQTSKSGTAAGKHRVPFQQKLVHGDQSTSGPRPAGHVPISKSTGLVVAVLRVGPPTDPWMDHGLGLLKCPPWWCLYSGSGYSRAWEVY